MVNAMQKDSNAGSAGPATGVAASSVVSQEEWETKYATVTGLLPAYKSCKAEEAAARAELETLQFTLTTVREQRKAVEEGIAAQERQVGAEGFAQASVLLDKVRMALYLHITGRNCKACWNIGPSNIKSRKEQMKTCLVHLVQFQMLLGFLAHYWPSTGIRGERKGRSRKGRAHGCDF